MLDDCFGEHQYDLESLFGDEKRRIVDALTRSTLEDAEASHQTLFDKHRATMRFLTELEVPSPAVLSVAAEVVLNAGLRRALAADTFDDELARKLLAEAVTDGVRLDETSLAYAARQSLDAMALRFFEDSADVARLSQLRRGVLLALALPFEVDLWKVQNLYFHCLEQAPFSIDRSEEWRDLFHDLGKRLSMRLP